jgi:hypothetical protein
MPQISHKGIFKMQNGSVDGKRNSVVDMGIYAVSLWVSTEVYNIFV